MMTQEQAIAILIQVAHIAQKAGAISLQDAPAVAAAVQLLSPKKEEVVEKKEEPKSK